MHKKDTEIPMKKPNYSSIDAPSTLNTSSSATKEKSKFEITKLIDHVTLVEKIGEGNFGEIYKGKWHGTEVAIKKIKTKHPNKLHQ